MRKQRKKQAGGKNPATNLKTSRVRWFVVGTAVVAAVVGFAVFKFSRAHSTSTAGMKPKITEAEPASPFAPTIPNKTPAPPPAPEGMVWIPGGEFSMGSTV